jgi:hypothetical protein
MIKPEESDQLEATRVIGRMISEFREEFMDRIRQTIEDEADQVVADGFDPARGSGRGPMWAEGG